MGLWRAALFAAVLLAPAAAEAGDREVINALDRNDGAAAISAATTRPMHDYALGEAMRDGFVPAMSVARDWLARYPKWPERRAIVASAENHFSDLTDREVVAWTKDEPPISAGAVIRAIDARLSLGMKADAVDMIRNRWISAPMGPQDEKEFIARYGAYMQKGDIARRVDRLIWDNQIPAAKRLAAQLTPGERAAVTARLALLDGAKNAATLASKVPASSADDPGLMYARVKYRREHDDTNGAIALLSGQPHPLTLNTAASAWWQERHILARRLIEDRQYKRAYQIVRAHGLTDEHGADFAAAEFLAGWLQLRYLHDPAAAAEHFARLADGVNGAISLSRARYWQGRTEEMRKNLKAARAFYEQAAVFPTTFYGQLALSKLQGNAAVLDVPDEPSVAADLRRDRFSDGIIAIVARLVDLGETDRAAELFPSALNTVTERGDYALLGEISRHMDRPDLALRAAKVAQQKGVVLPDYGYPTIALPTNNEIEKPLILAFIRQESEFRTSVKSGAGAQGLMQLMPGTAKLMARDYGLSYSEARLSGDPLYNVALGQHYAATLIDNFDGSYVMAIASYNAGPGRIKSWIDIYGDPRPGHANHVDPIDWLESIPIYETRNYVQRVVEAMEVYRARLKGGRAPLRIVEDLSRGS